ncbi:MAG: DsbA family protein [Polaromonas sp.]|nr:DsbA family protein [Polaromonas sp.]
MNKVLNVTYLFDPLCGWCYGAAPALRQISAMPGVTLTLAPSGLFCASGSRVMDAAFAAYAWHNDQRIERLTGQRFSERYRDQVLAATGTGFDSGPATLALSAVQLSAPERELSALHAIQEARYLDGRATSEVAVLADVLRAMGLPAAATRLLGPDEALLATHRSRVARAQLDMQALGAQGVPQLIVADAQGRRLVRGDVLYGNPEGLRDSLLRPVLLG